MGITDFIEIVLRGALGFGLLLAITRLIGNKQLGQLNVFTYVSGIAMGAMAGGMVIYRNIEVAEAVIGLILWGSMTIVLEKGVLSYRPARTLLNGEPVLIVKQGKIQADALRKERLSTDDLSMLLRTNEVFSLDEVAYAFLEPNGDLSVLKKQNKDASEEKALSDSAEQAPLLPLPIISDGVLITENMRESGLSEAEMTKLLLQQGFSSLDEVLYAERKSDGKLLWQRKTEDD